MRAQSLKNAAVLCYCTTNSALFKLILSSRDHTEEDSAGRRIVIRTKRAYGQAVLTTVSPIISIHAPVRGATILMFHCISDSVQFQSTLPHGERHFLYFDIALPYDFNPRSRTGSDCKNAQNISAILSIASQNCSSYSSCASAKIPFGHACLKGGNIFGANPPAKS